MTPCSVNVGSAAHTSAAAPATCGVEYDVPVPYAYRPSPANVARGYSPVDAAAVVAPRTWTPGAASETYFAAVENGARLPVAVDDATARPWEPTRTAGEDWTLPPSPGLPAATTSSTPCAIA